MEKKKKKRGVSDRERKKKEERGQRKEERRDGFCNFEIIINGQGNEKCLVPVVAATLTYVQINRRSSEWGEFYTE